MADGIIAPNVLYIMNPKKINPDDILVVRKRMSTPVTTPVAEAMLQMLAGERVTAKITGPSRRPTAKFHAHLQELCGTPVNTSVNPVVSTAGLAALSSLWVSLIARGGVDVVMCSTAYGGSVQMTEIFDKKESKFVKHDFHIGGKDARVTDSIKAELAKLAARKQDTLPTTVVFLEVPTNPDMKMPDWPALVQSCLDYKKAAGKDVLLLIDTTFAPGSKIMQSLRDLSEELQVIAFISLSKSVSRGLTTAGAVVANHTEVSKEIVLGVADTCKMLDTTAKPDQMLQLVEHHAKVDERNFQAYRMAAAVGDSLVDDVLEVTGKHMSLGFVSPDYAAAGFTTSSFSFNLPPLEDAPVAVNEELAQKFVDILVTHDEFKPCVSFGQDNGLVYATVPATSTQGAVKAEHKAKQAEGGVQLVRLSFPPTCNKDVVCKIIKDALLQLYKGRSNVE